MRAKTRYKGQGGHNDKQRKKLLKDLEDRLAATEARAEQYSPALSSLCPLLCNHAVNFIRPRLHLPHGAL